MHPDAGRKHESHSLKGRAMFWHTQYSHKLQTADDALRYVQSGMRVYIQPGCAEPEILVEALIRRAPVVRNV